MPTWCSRSRPHSKTSSCPAKKKAPRKRGQYSLHPARLQRQSATRDRYLARSTALRRNGLDLLALLTTERNWWLGDKDDRSRAYVISIVVIVGRDCIDASVRAVEWLPVEIPVVARRAEHLSRMKGMHLETAGRIGWRIERRPRKRRCNSYTNDGHMLRFHVDALPTPNFDAEARGKSKPTKPHFPGLAGSIGAAAGDAGQRQPPPPFT
jgi:hypothetical protein